MIIEYQPKGVCSKHMTIDVEDGVVRSFQVVGGCNGNLKGSAKLVEGMKVEDVVSRLDGIRCGAKESSCPGQLAEALKSSL